MSDLRVLVVDDEKGYRDDIKEYLVDSGFMVFTAGLPSEALAVMENERIDIAIVDLRLPEMSGIELMKKIRQIDEQIGVIIISGHGDMDSVLTAMRDGAIDFFPKPFDLVDIRFAIERTRKYIEMHSNLNEIRNTCENLIQMMNQSSRIPLIGESPGMKEVFRLMSQVSPNLNTDVLITGESGTGKELVARSIHHLSARNAGYFCAVNCAAIPDNLFESECFGYEKGSFTGAQSAKPGWFEMADHGSLFLDEIGDMNALMQAKLLRISEDGQVRRIGSTRDRNVDVRIITATNRDIDAMVASGSFRGDLFHRINTFMISIPPLRERTADIPLLISYYLELICNKTGKKICSMEAELMDKLMSYSFPGNVRELKNILERAVILCDGKQIRIRHLRSDLWCCNPQSNPSSEPDELFDLKLIERQTIERALKKTGGNKLQAARLLNISWQALDRRVKDMDG